jgi:hypothetical protein
MEYWSNGGETWSNGGRNGVLDKWSNATAHHSTTPPVPYNKNIADIFFKAGFIEA